MSVSLSNNPIKSIYMEQFEKLLLCVRRITDIDRQRHAEARKRGECYNVFNVLGVQNVELSHSAFLAALLDPNGDHGMQDAFLKAFIGSVIHGSSNLPLDTAAATVATEYYTGNGRIDLLITDSNRHAIIIENKIWAADQPAQLQRYNDYACANYTDYLLLYLTLDGKEPTDQSKGELTDYQCISYRNDIIGWLRQCAQLAFDKPRVRETILQYINVLQQLTNQNTMDKEQLIQLLSEKDNFAQACAIADNMPAVKQHLVEITLREQLQDDRYEIIESTYDRGNFGGISLRPTGWERCIIKFEFERYNGTTELCYGILDEHKPFMDLPRQDGYQQDGAWLVWNWMPRYRYWDNATFLDIHSGAVACEFKSHIAELLSLVETNHWQL